jgi:23S rRNA (guanosine2251-2'-O)-methyltransferase
MKDDRARGPRISRRADVPPARRVDEQPEGAEKMERPRYAGYRPAARAEGPKPRMAENAPAEQPENLLTGRNPIREALRAETPIDKLIVLDGDLSGAAREIIALAREKGIVVQKVSRQRLDSIYPAHQGMVAYVAQAEYSSVEDMLRAAKDAGEEPFLVILDGVTDPHNLGAVIRSAECGGAHGVIIPERRASGLTPAAAKAAAGALSYVKVARVTNLNRTIDDLKEAGVWVVAAALAGEDAFSADLTGPIALVVGSEGEGISRLTLEKCDRKVTLPMKGKIGSLNASVAAGILIYEVVRARTGA